MLRSRKKSPAVIQYMGSDGMTSYCKDAVMRILQYGNRIVSAKIISTPSGPESKSHAMVLNVDDSYSVAIKAGFASGYLGTGPSGFSSILKLLHDHKVEMSEYDVSREFMDRLNDSLLTNQDIETLDKMQPVRPSQIYDYIYESDWKKNQWAKFPSVIPFAIVDVRISDLALDFPDDPDDSLLKGYRRLEDIVRKRTGIDEHGVKLFQQAFVGEAAKLTWKDMSASERVGRGNLFVSIYQAYRNPRAHREAKHKADAVPEFLLLNHLYSLESQAVEQPSNAGASK